jgi:hypothetical protein
MMWNSISRPCPMLRRFSWPERFLLTVGNQTLKQIRTMNAKLPADFVARVARRAPSVVLSCDCEIDHDYPDQFPDGVWPHQVTVRAVVIYKGAFVDGCSTIAGVLLADDEELGDIHGHLYQLADEALDNLIGALAVVGAPHLGDLRMDVLAARDEIEMILSKIAKEGAEA